jgi:acetyl/propionyl-CoA carboxylase alpha subunit/acetyl-CoA carboxylase carboxyltransferase component
MKLQRLLIANRGEIAIRVARTASEMGIETVAVFSEDDADSLHRRRADLAHGLQGRGAAAYLDAQQLIEAAKLNGCDAVHPGYGFLSESADFARQSEQAGLVFVGPSPELLELFGDKTRARAAAAANGVPVLAGTSEPADLGAARSHFAALEPGQAMIFKAVAGGGGRGVRVVRAEDELEEAFTRSRSEAAAAFGNDSVYVETYLERARHVEVQIVGDGARVIHLGERDCSLQRRFQKLVEIAPAPHLGAELREALHDAAVRLAEATGYDNVGTFEFLVDVSPQGANRWYFIEANARLQVEHTVTEQVTGADLVALQLEIASGRPLSELIDGAVGPAPLSRGCAIQARVNLETLDAEGRVRPTGGVLAAFDPPGGPGVRVDTFGYAGYRTSSSFDSLLAKVIAHSPSGGFDEARRRLLRALGELHVAGVDNNAPLLQALLAHADVVAGRLHTRLLDEQAAELAAGAREYATTEESPGDSPGVRRAGVEVDSSDPLAVLTYGRQTSAAAAADDAGAAAVTPEGTIAVLSPVQGTVVSLDVGLGDEVREGQQLLVMEAMKMEHEVRTTASGIVDRIVVAAGDTIWDRQPLLFVRPAEVEAAEAGADEHIDLDEIRPDLGEVLERRTFGEDDARPEAVERRRKKAQRTARENVYDLVDEGSFLEYGPIVIAAQRRRRSLEDLIANTPADGMITGVGSINGELFAEPASRCAVLSYDYTVLAGTQGTQNHRKTDRLISVAEDQRLPLVLFAEGGGGRPGDTDQGVGGPGDTRTFSHFAKLSGLVPLVGITSGRCFAGNASLLGCCDVIIATANSNIGMGGPAMIEGGGLGVFAPEDIGPMSVQVPNGVVDLAVADEAAAVAQAKKYLSYFQGPIAEWQAHDQRLMRRIVPENRLRVYEVRRVVETLADVGSVLELRGGFGAGMVTALVRVEGRPLGVVANNPGHLGGAIDSDGADKAARFLQLCDAFDLPVLYLCDTPGIMVGPEVEKTALVRHANRLFLIGANISVPYCTIVLRKAYGLGAIAMAGGSYKEPAFTVSWPTGEFGGMGLEGAVKLGYRKELAAIDDPEERRARYEEMVAAAYENGKGLNQASQFAVDDTIDPMESREWVARSLASVRPGPPRAGKKRPAVDAW